MDLHVFPPRVNELSMGCLGLLGDLRIVPRCSPTEGERVHPARIVFTVNLAVNQPRLRSYPLQVFLFFLIKIISPSYEIRTPSSGPTEVIRPHLIMHRDRLSRSMPRHCMSVYLTCDLWYQRPHRKGGYGYPRARHTRAR